MTKIEVIYSSIDGVRKARTFKTISGARKFAETWVGKTPEIGFGYAVCNFGVGRITCDGCDLVGLFPALQETAEVRQLENWEIDMIEGWENEGIVWTHADLDKAAEHRKARIEARFAPPTAAELAAFPEELF